MQKSIHGLLHVARRSPASPRSRKIGRLHARFSVGTSQRQAPARGFTLIEVLVALAVLAIALAAVVRTMGQSIDLAADLRERTLALWVAQERAALLQLTKAWPDLATARGTAEMGGREWEWQERTSSTEVAAMRRVDIEVRAPRSPDLRAHVSIFLRKP